MSDVKIDEELKKDVKILFENHSNEIVNVNDVFDVKEKLNIKVACFENEDIYPKLLKSKKEAQIILNLYKAPAIYKDLKVLSECDLENSCEKVSFNNQCCDESAISSELSFTNPHKEGNNDYSHHTDEFGEFKCNLANSCKDNSFDETCCDKSAFNDKSCSNDLLSTVIDKLYQYVFYFLIAKHFEILEIFKSIPGIERIEYVKCSCCDTENEPTVWQCTACGDSLLSFYEAKIDEYERSKIKEIEDTISCNTESVVNKDLTSDDEKRREEPDSQVADKHVEKDLDWTKWKCKKCGLVNEDENVNCVVCMEARTDWICKQCTFINEMTREQCKICEESREGKANNKDDNNVKKEGIIDSWYCWYGKCKKRNDGNELYCTHCGLDKSANRERGAAVDMNKYGKKQQVWICYACYHINYDLTSKICGKCFESKFDVKNRSNEDDKTIAGYVMIESGDVNKWRCKQCKCVNGEECLSCEQCDSPRLEIWSCKKCTADNKISEDHCAACGGVNENRIIKYCSECKRGEIICDDLCGDCLKVRDKTWTCWYRFCENGNPGNVKYCKHCGLDRDARKIDIGAPMWRCTGDVPREIWICDKCSYINDISHSYCRHKISHYSTCFNKPKYTKWCYECQYRYNHENSKYCKMCNEKLR